MSKLNTQVHGQWESDLRSCFPTIEDQDYGRFDGDLIINVKQKLKSFVKLLAITSTYSHNALLKSFTLVNWLPHINTHQTHSIFSGSRVDSSLDAWKRERFPTHRFMRIELRMSNTLWAYTDCWDEFTFFFFAQTLTIYNGEVEIKVYI